MTTTSSRFPLQSCQASAFTPDHQLATGRFFRDLFPAWSRKFDAEPIVAPGPEGLRFALTSTSRMWRCEIAGPRIDLYWLRPEPQAPAIQPAEFYTAAAAFLAEYTGFFALRVGRLAAVIQRLAVRDDASAFLGRHFCRDAWQDEVLDRAQSFDLHVHRRLSLAGRFDVNARLRSATGIAANVPIPGAIVVEQDVNTLAEHVDARDFHGPEMAEFFTLAAREMERALAAVYPEPTA